MKRTNYWYLLMMSILALACLAVFHGCGTSNGVGVGGKVIISGGTT